METKTKIIIRRSSEWMNRLRNFKVIINGTEAGSLKNGATEEFSVEPGSNSIQCKVDWYSSKPFTIEVKEGETLYLRVGSGMKLYWPFFIAIIVGVFLVFHYKGKPERPEWLTPVTIVLLAPGVLYSLYYTTIGRKNYLVVQKDTKNVFA
ncbi:MAG: hypothetical protein JST17_04620 [Bacteroidetes bacterium]|nr:hypothetical protein [Bacteroidota bacterium]MBS1929693.1 hypothetical protein [Bacteroidota bacterium]